MITIKYLSEEANYNEVLEVLKNALGEHYIGDLDDYNHAPYGIDAVAVYNEEGTLLDIRLFDPYHKVADGIYTNFNGDSNWLLSYCDNEDLMREGGISEEDIETISEL